MNREEACRILGVRRGEDPTQVRRKYHLLLHRYHPDSAGDEDPENLEWSRKVIEAFRFLKREAAQGSLQAGKAWGVRENEAAYCSRNIYMEDNLFGDSVILDTGSTGRYFWDPELETFSMFLRSIGEAVRGCMDDVSDLFGPEKEAPSDEVSMKFRTRLLHLLIQEFIDPYECLDQMYPYICRLPGQGVRYGIQCHIMAEEEVLRKMQEGSADEKWLIRATGNRLFAGTESAGEGQIAFEETGLYYVVIPLFLQDAVLPDMQILERKEAGRGKAPYLKARLIVSVDRKRKRDLTKRITNEILDTLEQYRACFT